MSSRTIIVGLTALALATVACSGGDAEKKQELTQREKDSVFARSRIPGAKAVGTALRNADSANLHVNRLEKADSAQ